MESRSRRPAGVRESVPVPAGVTRPGARLNRRSPLETTARSRSYLLRIILGLALAALLTTQAWLWRARPQQQTNNGWMHHLRQFDPENEAEDPLAPPQPHDVPAVPIEALEASGVMAPAALAERRAKFDPASHNADQKQVVDMVKWAWKGYETFAFGHDSLNVKTMTGTGLPGHDMALTLVDALDTLYLVGMFDEFDRASQWVAANMDQRIFLTGFISLFETTIRLLGGLLSSYYLSGEDHLLELANKLGAALSPAFDEYPHGMPDKDYDIVRKRTRAASSLAEVGSVQLEFKYLARLTGHQRYFDQVERISDSLAKQVKERHPTGLLPVNINQRNGLAGNAKITLGANGDSYYEYLLKQWLLSGKKDDKFKREYLTAVDSISSKLVGKSKPNGLVFIGELVNGKLEPKMDHLVCFVPGMLALGHLHGMPKEHLTLAESLIETCHQMYARMEAKLAPEIVYFNTRESDDEDIIVSSRDAFNLLRPETVESLMIMYRVTKDDKYREYGRGIVRAFEKQCRLDRGGYASIGNVYRGPVKKGYRDEMESFFIAETLKYLFLLFSDESVLPLDEIVFNTEAHPFPVEPST